MFVETPENVKQYQVLPGDSGSWQQTIHNSRNASTVSQSNDAFRILKLINLEDVYN